MSVRTLRVVVVGGGVIGAAVAWYLVRAGARVTLFERGAVPACGATRWSYGWVGTGSTLPSENPARFALVQAALPEFSTLQKALGPLPVAARGALVWLESETETTAFVAEQRAAGVRIEEIGRAAVEAMEPSLAKPPALAAWMPDDFAVEPIELTAQLLSAAQALGACVRYGCQVESVETRNGRCTGVHTPAGAVPADVVVLANAASAGQLAATAGVRLQIVEKPAVLLQFASSPCPIKHMLYGQGLELRPSRSGGLVSAADLPDTGKNGLPELEARTASAIAELIKPPLQLATVSVRSAMRAMTLDGAPLRGFVDSVPSLYAVVAHPGVILAPQLGRLAAGDILASS